MKLKNDEGLVAEASLIIPGANIEKREGKLLIKMPLDRKLVAEFDVNSRGTAGAMYAVIPDGGHIKLYIGKNKKE